MKLTPRDYQQEAHDAAIAWIKKCVDPCLIEAPTGSGKSVIVAMLASEIKTLWKNKLMADDALNGLIARFSAELIDVKED